MGKITKFWLEGLIAITLVYWFFKPQELVAAVSLWAFWYGLSCIIWLLWHYLFKFVWHFTWPILFLPWR